MRTLTATSIVSVLCAASVWLYAAPQLVFRGMVDLGPLVGAMVVLPTVVGLIAALVGVFAGGIELARRRPGLMGCTVLMALGQVVTWGIAIAVIVWAAAFGSTGWELLALPASLMLGQILVAAGLVLRQRRGTARGLAPAVEQIEGCASRAGRIPQAQQLHQPDRRVSQIHTRRTRVRGCPAWRSLSRTAGAIYFGMFLPSQPTRLRRKT